MVDRQTLNSHWRQFVGVRPSQLSRGQRIIEKSLTSLIISIIVLSAYGTSLLAGLYPFQIGVSWEGYLSGMIAGVICAFTLASSKKS